MLSLSLLFATSWSATFTPHGLVSYLAPESAHVLVVAAGPGAQPPADAMLAVLKQVKSASSSATFGDFSALDDQSILAKCKNLPFDTVAVVRATSEPANAMITFYRSSGEAIAGARVEAGNEMEPRHEAAAPVVHDVPSAGPAHSADYDRKYLWFSQQLYIAAGYHTAIVGVYDQPRQGKYGVLLDWQQFYDMAAPPGLAEEYRSRHRTRTGLIIGGWVGVGAGAIVTALFPVFLQHNICDVSFGGTCVAQDNSPAWTMLAVGGGLMIAGGIIATVGAFMNPHPVPADQLREFADEYNQRITDKEPVLKNIAVAPMVTAKGAGMGLSAQF